MQHTRDTAVLSGDPKQAILTVATPLLLAAAIAQINSFIDTFWCSSPGTEALADMPVSSPLYLILVDAGSGLSVGVAAAIDNRLGRKDRIGAGKLLGQALICGLGVGLIFIVPFLLGGNLLLRAIGNRAFFTYSRETTRYRFFSRLEY
ncbi:MAG: MATE family efflux transporter [Candidatus Methanomethylophilus sp.]|nr:MATE family efflux transporter [Methanomethylophilus sp.]